MSDAKEFIENIKNQYTWDTSSKELGYLHNHSEDAKKVKDLSVAELRSIIKEVVMEEVSKIHFIQPVMPVQPLPYIPENYKYDVWCSQEGDNNVR